MICFYYPFHPSNDIASFRFERWKNGRKGSLAKPELLWDVLWGKLGMFFSLSFLSLVVSLLLLLFLMMIINILIKYNILFSVNFLCSFLFLSQLSFLWIVCLIVKLSQSCFFWYLCISNKKTCWLLNVLMLTLYSVFPFFYIPYYKPIIINSGVLDR